MLKIFLLPIFFSAFLLADSAYSQISDVPPFTGDTAGIVNGRPITRKDYTEMLSIVTGQMMQKKSGSLTGQEILEAHRKTWENLVNDAIVSDSIEKKGIIVTDAEVRSMLENDPPLVLSRQFTDSAGKFHKEDYLEAMHNPHNDSIVRILITVAKPEMQKQKFSNMLLASITVNDEELWKEYKDQKGATRKKFESEKEELRKRKLLEKQQAFFVSWFASAKANTKIIDYRTIK